MIVFTSPTASSSLPAVIVRPYSTIASVAPSRVCGPGSRPTCVPKLSIECATSADQIVVIVSRNSSQSNVGRACSTPCPSCSSRAAVASQAPCTRASPARPDHGSWQNAMRSGRRGPASSSAYARAGAGATLGSPGAGALSTSSVAAVSRTLRVTTKCTAQPPSGSADEGAQVTRPRVGLRPTTPQAAAGMRIDPPPSLAVATGTIPAPTAAALPPLEPPAMRSALHGLQVGPCASVSVVPITPNSEVVVRPIGANPAPRSRDTISEGTWTTQPSASRLPFSHTRPASPWKRSFSSSGTPPKGPPVAPAASPAASWSG